MRMHKNQFSERRQSLNSVIFQITRQPIRILKLKSIFFDFSDKPYNVNYFMRRRIGIQYLKCFSIYSLLSIFEYRIPLLPTFEDDELNPFASAHVEKFYVIPQSGNQNEHPKNTSNTNQNLALWQTQRIRSIFCTRLRKCAAMREKSEIKVTCFAEIRILCLITFLVWFGLVIFIILTTYTIIQQLFSLYSSLSL